MKKTEPLQLGLRDKNFLWIGLIQSFVYRCHDTMHEKYLIDGSCKKKTFEELYNKWFKNLFEESELFFDIRVTYDETLWPPVDVLYGSIMMLEFKTYAMVGHYIMRIDFTKPIFESVSLLTHEGKFPTNIFNVQYFKEELKKY